MLILSLLQLLLHYDLHLCLVSSYKNACGAFHLPYPHRILLQEDFPAVSVLMRWIYVLYSLLCSFELLQPSVFLNGYFLLSLFCTGLHYQHWNLHLEPAVNLGAFSKRSKSPTSTIIASAVCVLIPRRQLMFFTFFSYFSPDASSSIFLSSRSIFSVR